MYKKSNKKKKNTNNKNVKIKNIKKKNKKKIIKKTIAKKNKYVKLENNKLNVILEKDIFYFKFLENNQKFVTFNGYQVYPKIEKINTKELNYYHY